MKWKENGQFENPPSGSHIARCIGVVDMGSQPHSWLGESWTSRDVRISFELPSCPMEGKYKPELKGKPFGVFKVFKQSMHSSAGLREFLNSWRGRKFTKEEIAVYDPKKLLGVPCRLTLVENGDFVNIEGVSKLNPNEVCPAQVNSSVYFSLEPDEFKADVMSGFSEKMQEKIKSTPEWAALVSPKHDDSAEEAEAGLAPAGEVEEDPVPF